MARAITQIDQALIEEADEMPSRRKLISPQLLTGLTRYGSIAACLVLLVGAVLLGNMRGPNTLLYGEEITEQPRMITEYIPRSIAYSLEPVAITEVSLPLELEFSRKTHLTASIGELIVIDGDGNVTHRGTEFAANGEVSLCLSLPEGTQSCVIETDRDYNIVLELDGESGLWYVKIDK